MRVLLVYPDSPDNLNIGRDDRGVKRASKRAYAPPLGLLTVAAILPQDWHFELVDLSFQEVTAGQWHSSDMVIVSGTIPHLRNILRIVKEAKSKGKIVAVGGPAVFHFPERVLEAGADFAVKGEGERTVPLLLEALAKGEYGRLIEDTTQADLTASPLPRFDLIDMSAYVDMALQFSRGCPFRCEFCDATLIFGRKVRKKTPAQIVRELDLLYELGWRRRIYIVDDNFIGNPKRTKELLQEMISWTEDNGRPFELFTHASVNLGADPELMDLMVRAGFTGVYLGIETTDRDALKAMGKSQNVAVDLGEACRSINRAGLEITAGTMIGLDGEQTGRDLSLIELAEHNRIPLVEVALLHAYPGTDLWHRLRNEGRLVAESNGDPLDDHYLTINFVPTRPQDEIIDELFNAMSALYDPAAFLERAFDSFARMDPPPVELPSPRPTLSELRALAATLLKWGLIWPTRWRFWTLLWKAARQYHPQRFYGLIRSCIMLEHYLALSTDMAKHYGRSTHV